MGEATLRHHLSVDALAVVFDALDDAVLLVDGSQNLLAWNSAATRMGGLRPEHEGFPWKVAVAGAPLDGADGPTQGAGPETDADEFWVDAWGRDVAVRVRAVSVFLHGGERGVAIIASDRTEEHQMQVAIAESHRQLAETQSLAHVGLWVWDRVADNLQWTEELYRIHDVDPLAFEGTLAAHVAGIPEPDRSEVHQALLAAVDGPGGEVALAYPVDGPGGRRWVASRARPMRADDGAITGLVGTCQDVTERMRYEHAIEMANEELERFASAVAHDLKSPLTVMVGMAELIAMQLKPEPGSDVAMMLSRISSSGMFAGEMIGELMSSAKARAKERSFSPVDLDEVMGTVRRGLTPALVAAGVELRVQSLPVVEGSRALLRQLLRNLVGNAIKYREPSRTARIEVSAATGDDGWQIRVRDNGRGIAAAERPTVFDAGVRIGWGDDIEGDGVGLATCRSIVEQHGGSIHVEDGLEGGVTVVVWLPRQQLEDERPSGAAA